MERSNIPKPPSRLLQPAFKEKHPSEAQSDAIQPQPRQGGRGGWERVFAQASSRSWLASIMAASMLAPQTGARTPLDQPCWSDSVSTATTGRPRGEHPGRGPRATSVSSPAAPAFCVQLGAPRVTYSSHSIPKINLVATRQTRAEMMDAEQHLCLKVPTHSARASGLNASAPMADGMAPPRLRLETKARGNFRPSYGSLLGATICSSTISTPGPDEARVHTSHTISQPYGYLPCTMSHSGNLKPFAGGH